MRENTWILIADASRARLFSTAGKLAAWSLKQEFSHPESTAKGREIVSDKPGRVQHRIADRNRSAMAPPTPPKEAEAKHFAHELATALEQAFGRNAYRRLVLVAPPHFLGMLRGCVSSSVSKAVVATLDKDLTHINERELPDRIREVL